MLSLDLSAKKDACGMGRVHSFWGVVLLARVSWETTQHVTVFWQQFLHSAEDLAAQKICSLRSKQEIGERTRGRLMFRARIHIVSWCVCKARKGCVYMHSSCEVVSFRTVKKHTFTQKSTHIHTSWHTGFIVAPSVCLWRCSLRVLVVATSVPKHRMQGGCFQAQSRLHTQLHTYRHTHTHPYILESS